MAQGKTKIKSKVPKNSKNKSNKTNKQNSAFQKRKRMNSKKLTRLKFENHQLYFRRASSEEDGRKTKNSS